MTRLLVETMDKVMDNNIFVADSDESGQIFPIVSPVPTRPW